MYTQDTPCLSQRFERDGFVTIPDVLPPDVLEKLKNAFAAPVPGGAGGIRNVLRTHAAARDVASSDTLRRLLYSVVGDGEYVPVRGIVFDKAASSGGTNWKVPFHQDLSIAVRERPDSPVPGYDVWSAKEGVVHVQPPVALLERLVTVRLHLDNCDAETGPLRVLPSTHRCGRLPPDKIARCRSEEEETVCVIPEGGALVFRPLLLHASSPATRPGARRRVLHVEFAPADLVLPSGIHWHEADGATENPRTK